MEFSAIIIIVIFIFIINSIIKASTSKIDEEQKKLINDFKARKNKETLDKLKKRNDTYRGEKSFQQSEEQNRMSYIKDDGKEYKYIFWGNPRKREKEIASIYGLFYFNTKLKKEEKAYFETYFKHITTNLLRTKNFEEIEDDIGDHEEDFTKRFEQSAKNKNIKFNDLDLYITYEEFEKGDYGIKEYDDMFNLYNQDRECFVTYESIYEPDAGYLDVLFYDIFTSFEDLPKDQYFDSVTEQLKKHLKKLDSKLISVKIDGFGEKVYDGSKTTSYTTTSSTTDLKEVYSYDQNLTTADDIKQSLVDNLSNFMGNSQFSSDVFPSEIKDKLKDMGVDLGDIDKKVNKTLINLSSKNGGKVEIKSPSKIEITSPSKVTFVDEKSQYEPKNVETLNFETVDYGFDKDESFNNKKTKDKKEKDIFKKDDSYDSLFEDSMELKIDNPFD